MSRRTAHTLVQPVPFAHTPRSGEGVHPDASFPDCINLDILSPPAAWLTFAQKLTELPLTLDLDRVGLDAQALALVPADIALELRVVPVRLISGVLIVVASHETYNRACRELPLRFPHLTCRIALANAVDLADSLEICYGPDLP